MGFVFPTLIASVGQAGYAGRRDALDSVRALRTSVTPWLGGLKISVSQCLCGDLFVDAIAA